MLWSFKNTKKIKMNNSFAVNMADSHISDFYLMNKAIFKQHLLESRPRTFIYVFQRQQDSCLNNKCIVP